MEKNLLIICETGISASLLLSKFLERVRERSLSYQIDYSPLKRLENKLTHETYDVILLTPQVAGQWEKIEETLKNEACNAKLFFITPEDFQYMNVDHILAMIQ